MQNECLYFDSQLSGLPHLPEETAEKFMQKHLS